MCTGPTSTPMAALRTSTAAPPAAHIQGSRGSPGRGAGLARALTPSTSGRLFLELLHVRRDRLQEIDEPRAPARSDVVIDLHDLARLDRADHAPARPRGDGAQALVAALGVGQDDQVGVGADDVLG